MDMTTVESLPIEPEGYEGDPSQLLSYDESVPYEEQLPNSTPEPAGLASRIGNTKVYLLSESSAARFGKRKRHGEEEEEESEQVEAEEDVEMDDDPTLRGNAILLQGPPISSLPTARLFAYATHFDAHPMGMEWVDDNTCVFVFSTKAAARTGLRYLSKSFGEEPDPDGFVTAKSIPITFWPPEERINNSLGKGQGLKGVIRMRWARIDDVKKKGAKKDSEFYRKHGTTAGKELFNGREMQPGGGGKRRRMDYEEDRARLDNELDNFLAEDDDAADATPVEPPSPPSKMRSDYIAGDGRTVLEKTSTVDLASRLLAPLPRRARRGGGGEARNGASLEERLWSHKVELSERIGTRRNDRHDGRHSRSDRPARNRPKKTQQELDDELDAFLKEE